MRDHDPAVRLLRSGGSAMIDLDVTPQVSMMFTEAELEDQIAALADVLCWHRGFGAARKHYQPPPGLEDLRILNIRLKTALKRLHEGTRS